MKETVSIVKYYGITIRERRKRSEDTRILLMKLVVTKVELQRPVLMVDPNSFL